MIYATNDPLGLITVERETGRRYFENRALARAIDTLCDWGVCDFDSDEDVDAYAWIGREFQQLAT